VILLCSVCNTQFDAQNKTAIYCSEKCSNLQKTKRRSERFKQQVKEQNQDGRKCSYCGNRFKPTGEKQTCCSEFCRKKRQQQVDRRSAEFRIDRNRIIAPLRAPKPKYKSPVTDEEQKLINAQVKAKFSIPPGPVKHLRPGDPEFEEIARGIINVEHIPQTHSSFTGGKYMEFRT